MKNFKFELQLFTNVGNTNTQNLFSGFTPNQSSLTPTLTAGAATAFSLPTAANYPSVTTPTVTMPSFEIPTITGGVEMPNITLPSLPSALYQPSIGGGGTSSSPSTFNFSGRGDEIVEDFVTGKNSDSSFLVFSTPLSSLRRESNYIQFDAANGSKLQVNNSSSVDEVIQFSTDGENISYAKVGYADKNNSFTYEDDVIFYSGGEHINVLNVANYQQGKNIWLDNSAGVSYNNINNIDASTSTGNNTLAGDSGNNQITAGNGNDLLWGGLGADSDTSIGGGDNTYFYGNNNGNDVIVNSVATDKIDLYDVRECLQSDKFPKIR